MALPGKIVVTLIGLAIVAAAAGLVWYIFWAKLLSWLAIAGALACAGLFAALGMILVRAPWRKADGHPDEGMQG